VSELAHEIITDISDLDDAIWSDNLWTWSSSRISAFKELHVRESAERHIRHCAPFGRLADRAGILGRDGGLAPLVDLSELPVIPTGVFKRATPLSIETEQVVHRFESSGTTGRKSVVCRDDTTLERLVGSVVSALSLIDNTEPYNTEVINLGPPREDAGSVWFAYVLSLIELSYPTYHGVQAGRLERSATWAHLRERLGSVENIAIVGPPFLLNDFMSSAAHGLSSEDRDRVIVVTAGGWKWRAGESMPREALDEKISRSFSLGTLDRVRDAFNQVELNTVFVECSARRKHIPPWVHAATRSFDALTELPPGETGLLAYFDASSISYPCFIVGDDIGMVYEDPCPCGSETPTIRVDRRLTTMEQRGCAAVLQRDLDAEPAGAL